MFSLSFLPVSEVKLRVTAVPVLATQTAQVYRLYNTLPDGPLMTSGPQQAAAAVVPWAARHRDSLYVARCGGSWSVDGQHMYSRD